MKIPFIDLKEQHRALKKPIRAAVARVIDSQQFVLKGEGASLEKRIAALTGASQAVGLASGSDALYLALLALGVGPGDEVVTTPFTFFATAGSISRTGATPVFADIDAATFNLDPARAAAAVTSRTKALLPVHLFGLPCDMRAILALAKKRGLAVIEDAAQAIGAECGGKPVGGLGDAGCLSFYPTKNLGGAGDGGMLVTRSEALAAKVRVLRDHGSTRKYHHDFIGINSRLDEMQAAVLGVKLGHIARWNALRRRHAADYDRGLRGLPLETPAVPAGMKHVYHLYSIQTDRRDELAAHLTSRGIGSGVYYPLPLHLQPCYRGLGYKAGDFPVCERVTSRVLSLPMFPEMSAGQKKAVISAVREFFGKK
ncbi:MAG TPA: DegT/DnrJ/EryC1/StrS family aminotransferase [Candidatus Eisenbacteria bacterium]|nr:DegT/DnrJ/EryC1/StrS family aminotransferase [Candidatus Eisenbacteria bacterium]